MPEALTSSENTLADQGGCSSCLLSPASLWDSEGSSPPWQASWIPFSSAHYVAGASSELVLGLFLCYEWFDLLSICGVFAKTKNSVCTLRLGVTDSNLGRVPNSQSHQVSFSFLLIFFSPRSLSSIMQELSKHRWCFLCLVYVG